MSILTGAEFLYIRGVKMKNHSFFKLSSILTFLIIAISCNSDQKSMNNEKVNVSTKNYIMKI